MTWKTGNADEFLEDTMDDKMTEHVHGLDIGLRYETFEVYAECGCGYVLSQEEIKARLNATERLSANALLETLADIEHERWSSWMQWMFDHWTDENIERWKQQMLTPYADLPEHSKESDRKEVRKTLAAIADTLEGKDG